MCSPAIAPIHNASTWIANLPPVTGLRYYPTNESYVKFIWSFLQIPNGIKKRYLCKHWWWLKTKKHGVCMDNGTSSEHGQQCSLLLIPTDFKRGRCCYWLVHPTLGAL